MVATCLHVYKLMGFAWKWFTASFDVLKIDTEFTWTCKSFAYAHQLFIQFMQCIGLLVYVCIEFIDKIIILSLLIAIIVTIVIMIRVIIYNLHQFELEYILLKCNVLILCHDSPLNVANHHRLSKSASTWLHEWMSLVLSHLTTWTY